MKKRLKKDFPTKSQYYSWKAFLVTYIVLIILTTGQALIYDAYISMEKVPLQYIFGIAGYWLITSFIFSFIAARQKYKAFDQPMHRLSEAAKQVADGDFSIYLEPVHTADKKDYMDFMFDDFNKMVEELGSIETLKNDFISNVSHEMKTPLSVIQGYAMALQKEDLPYELRKEYSDTIISASKKLTALISNILKLNKLENQEINPVGEPFNLCRQLCDCALYFEKLWEEKNINFSADIEERVIIKTNESMLEIIWYNLLSNALKFTDSGGSITLRQTSDKDKVTVTISDTGCGMDKETMNHIFDKFYQGDTSRSEEGNGIGLALTLRVIELIGGTISVKSELQKGTTFSVELYLGK